jgi:ketosteroid isomerase-like protein
MKNIPQRLRSHSGLALALTLAVAALAAIHGMPAAAQGGDEQAVRAVLLQNAAGFERGDLEALNRAWAQDESVTVFESGHANYGWADYRDRHLVPEMKEMKNTRYTLSDIRVKVAGTTAWATFKYALTADLKDRRVEAGGLGTAVLEKRGDQWKIVHWHTSAPRRAPAPQATPAPHKH